MEFHSFYPGLAIVLIESQCESRAPVHMRDRRELNTALEHIYRYADAVKFVFLLTLRCSVFIE